MVFTQYTNDLYQQNIYILFKFKDLNNRSQNKDLLKKIISVQMNDFIKSQK